MKSAFTVRILPTLFSVCLLAGCGSGGGGGPAATASSNMETTVKPIVSYAVETDTYGMQRPTWLHVSDNALGVVIRGDIVTSDQLMWFDTTVFRVDCPSGLATGEYPLGARDSACTVSLLNGRAATTLSVSSGTLSVARSNGWLSGRASVTFKDAARPSAVANFFSATFAAPVGSGAAPAILLPPVPADAAGIFGAKCAACHSVATLAGKGDGLDPVLDVTSHPAVLASASERYSLKILLNSTH
jgi:hypothetical protein